MKAIGGAVAQGREAAPGSAQTPGGPTRAAVAQARRALSCRLLVVWLAVVWLGSGALAQNGAYPCLPDLEASGDEEPLGRLAVQWVADTIRELEPALPRTRTAGQLPLAPDDPLADAFRFLRERALLDPAYRPETFGADEWQALLDGVLARYGLPAFAVGSADAPEALRDDLARLVARVLAVVRPVALLAWDPDDDARLVFVGVMWNWSPYPRLLVWRPPEGWSMRDGPRVLAGRIDFCGQPVRDFVSAAEPVARSLFLSHADAVMYLVGSDPETRSWPYRVDQGDEVAVFAFEHPEVVEVETFSAVFVGEPPGVLQLARLVPFVRTNLSPVGMARAFQTPPRDD